MKRVAIFVPVLLAALVVSVVGGASSARAGGGTASWGRAIRVALPANAAVDQNQSVAIDAVSCASVGNCSAVGTYLDKSGSPYRHGLLLSEVNGVWGTGVEAQLPGNAVASSSVPLRSLSCSSAGNCTAVGEYQDSSGDEGLLVTETNGIWAVGVEAALPADAALSNQAVRAVSVSCVSPGNCIAVGAYKTNSNNNIEPLILKQTAGSWATGIASTLPADATTLNEDAGLESVSCSSAGNCTAVGDYLSTSGQDGLMVSETGGSWAAGVAPTLPADANTPNPYAGLASVSCSSAGNCSAIGSFESTTAQEALMLTQTSGSWGPGVESTLPANAKVGFPGPLYTVHSIACASAGNCTAVGSYFDNTIAVQGLLLTQTASTWATGVEAPLPANADPSQQGADVLAVSCTSAGNCEAAGDFGANTGGQGLFLGETAGSWNTGIQALLPADAYTNPSAEFDAISCPAATYCVAVGDYGTNSAGVEGAIATLAPTETLTITKTGSGSGAISSTPAGINCGSTCSLAFPYGTQVTLTATAQLGSAFTGWTGGGCSGTATCTVTMNNAQAVTATFAARPPATLKVSKHGSGTVKSTPSGISCGSTCSHHFIYGTSVTLTAKPAAGSVFTGWTGACTGTTATCHLSMTAARTTAATFVPTKLLTVTKTGAGSGTVTSSPAGIACGATCKHPFAAGTAVTLTASAKTGSTFTGWSGACSGHATCIVKMSAAKSVKATFG
jgi:hypothetical protein